MSSNVKFNFFNPYRKTSIINERKQVANEWKLNNPKIMEALKGLEEGLSNEKDLLQIVEFGNMWDALFIIDRNDALPSSLGRVLQNRSATNKQTVSVSYILSKNPNTPAHVLKELFENKYLASNGHVYSNLASNPNTPAEVLTKMLPNNFVNTKMDQTHVESIHFRVYKNENVPAMEALLSLQSFAVDKESKEEITVRILPRFIKEYYEKTGVDISDWPEDWVTELTKG